MNIEIDLFDETEQLNKDAAKLVKQIITYASEVEGIKGGAELSVTFVNNERIQEINREYRDKDQPTDVISFAMEEHGEGEMEYNTPDTPRMLGDIIISVPRAMEQAEEYGHSFQRELGFLALHGFLHLLGYDHMTSEDEKVMFEKQHEILEGFGLKRE